MKIKGFQWDQTNSQHILQRHGVTPAEIEEIFIGSPVFRKTYQGRRIALGQTEAGRYLLVVFLPVGEGRVRVISARDMEDNEKRYYRSKRRY